MFITAVTVIRAGSLYPLLSSSFPSIPYFFSDCLVDYNKRRENAEMTVLACRYLELSQRRHLHGVQGQSSNEVRYSIVKVGQHDTSEYVARTYSCIKCGTSADLLAVPVKRL